MYEMACKLGHHSWALHFAMARELQVITYQLINKRTIYKDF